MIPCTVAVLRTGTDNDDFVSAKTLKDQGLTFSAATILNLAGGTTQQLSLTTAGATNGLLIDGTTTGNGIIISTTSTSAIQITGTSSATILSIEADGATGLGITNTFSGTTMILLNGTATNGISITGACTQGISVTGASTSGIYVSGGATQQISLATSAAQKGLYIAGTAITTGWVIDTVSAIADATTRCLNIASTMSTAFTTAKVLYQGYFMHTSHGSDVTGATVNGVTTYLDNTALSKISYNGFNSTLAGTYTAGAGAQAIAGFNMVPTITINSATTTLYGINIDISGVTRTSAVAIYAGRFITTTTSTSAILASNGTNTVDICNTTNAINISGTSTNGILIGGTLTTGISIGTCITGISIIGASTSGISISGSATQQLLLTSTAAEKALTVTSTVQTVTPVTVASTSAISSAAYITAIISDLTVTGASGVNMIEANQFIVNSNVQTGNWINAVLAKIDFKTVGYSTGTAGVVCAELDMPGGAVTGAAGTYCTFESEINLPTNYVGGGVPIEVLRASVWGAQVAQFDTSGALFSINATLVSGATNFWYDHDGAVGGDTVNQWLKIRINGVDKWLAVYDATH
ncbi:hypothetical protein CCP3SC1AL1_310001 [Gammaproteobacteria bacterium]